jgi:lysophospholipase L1-like esterase
LQIIDRVLAELPGKSINIATVFFGANDAASSPQGISLEEFQENIKKILHSIKEKDAGAHIILITPPPIADEKYQKVWKNSERTLAKAKKYADIVRNIALELDAPLVDLWNVPYPFIDEDLDDGLHLSPSGNTKVYLALRGTIERSLPSLVPEAMKTRFPLWSELSGKSEEETCSLIMKSI